MVVFLVVDLNPVIYSPDLTRAIPEFFPAVFSVDVSSEWIQKPLSLRGFKSDRLFALLISCISSQFSLKFLTFLLDSFHFSFWFFLRCQRRNLGVVELLIFHHSGIDVFNSLDFSLHFHLIVSVVVSLVVVINSSNFGFIHEFPGAIRHVKETIIRIVELLGF